jgi:RHS repeat-associated protein
MRAADTHFFLHDANYNIVAAVEDSTNNVVERYAYTPYGEVTFLEADFDKATTQASTIDNQHLYTGRERDAETGLQLNRWRFYEPPLGRWMQRDPIGYAGSAYSIYLYVESVPVKLLDPTGTLTSTVTCLWKRKREANAVASITVSLRTSDDCALDPEPPDCKPVCSNSCSGNVWPIIEFSAALLGADINEFQLGAKMTMDGCGQSANIDFGELQGKTLRGYLNCKGKDEVGCCGGQTSGEVKVQSADRFSLRIVYDVGVTAESCGHVFMVSVQPRVGDSDTATHELINCKGGK